VGPELGCRTLDKLDLLLFPIVLLLRLSLLLYALLFSALRLFVSIYDACFNQAVAHGLQSELYRSLVFVTYLILRLVMLFLYWFHIFLGWILAPGYYFWKAISFWPRFFWHLFGIQAKGRSVWSILTDPEDKSSTARRLVHCDLPGKIRPLWSRYLVFTTYQVHGAFAHLHQHRNEDVEACIVESAGPALPHSWDPLRLTIPYEYLSARVPRPPDCYLAKLLAILLLLGLYSVPLVRGTAHISCLRLRALLTDSADTVRTRIALATTPRP